MTCYESTFIIKQDVSTQVMSEIIDNFASLVEKFGGILVKKEYWGLRTLAYTIKKNRKGHYVMLAIESDKSDIIKNLERMYNIDEKIIRHLTVKVDSLDGEPSIMMHTTKRDTEIAE